MTMKETILEKFFLLLPEEVQLDHLIKYLDVFKGNVKVRLFDRVMIALCILMLSYEVIAKVDDKILGWTISMSISVLIILSQLFKVIEIVKFAKSVKGGYYPLRYGHIIFPDHKVMDYFKENLGISSDDNYDEFIRAGGDELLKKIIKNNLRNYYWYKT